MPTNKLLLIVPILILALLVSLFLAYRAYLRSRLFEHFFNTLLLDPYQLENHPTGGQLPSAGNDVKTVVFFGDSRAAHWPFPDIPGRFQFINRGVEAQTSVLVAGRWSHHVALLEPDILVIQVGINDLRLIPAFEYKQDTILENTKTNIRQIVSDSLDIGTNVILATVFPLGPAPLDRRFAGEDAQVKEALEEINLYLQTLASDKVFVLDTAAILTDEKGRVRPEYSVDYLHINEAGYAALNQELARILRTIN